MRRIFCMTIIILALTVSLCNASENSSKKAEFWMMPSPWPNNGLPLRELINNNSGWEKTRQVIDGIGYWPLLLNLHFTDAEIQSFFTKMKSYNLKFGFEVFVIKKEYPNANESFALLKQLMSRFTPLGADVKWFSFDEPFYATKHVLCKPDVYAVDETAAFIKMLRTLYPEAKVGDVEPYPVLKLSELKSFITSLNAKCAEIGTKGIDFFRLDVDWCSMNNSYPGSWREVKDLEDFLRSRGIKSGLIYWAADQPFLENMNLSDDMTWYIGVMHQGNAYALAGGHPDEYLIESWVQVPKHAIPETDPSTFTGSVLGFYNRFLQIKNQK